MKTYILHKHLNIFGVDRELEIAFTFIPGQSETGPTYDSGGEPAYPPEVDVAAVRVCIPATRTCPEMWIDCEWLADAIHDAAREELADDFVEAVAMEDGE